MKIGFVGLGVIGTEMVKHLRAQNYDVVVYPRGAGLEEARAAAVRECANYVELAAQSDALILIVFTDEQMRDVLFNQGALAAMKPGSVLTIHVTGSPQLRQEIQDKAPVGVDVLDVTFSGSHVAAKAGTLTLMVGGKAEALERMRSVYVSYAKDIHHVGAKLGDAQVLKLLNNLVLAANMMNAVELLRVGESYGLDANRIAQVLKTCSGGSYAMSIFEKQAVPTVMQNAKRYMDKDVQEAVAAAKDIKLDLSAFDQTVRYFLPD